MDYKTYAKQLDDQGYPLTSRYFNAITKDAKELANKYRMSLDYDDFCQLALVEATRLEKVFSKDRGCSFMAFIRKPIKQVIQKMYGYSRSETNKFNKIVKFMEAYEKENGTQPTVPLIAKALGTTEWYVQSIYYGKPIKISLESLSEETLSNTADTNQEELVEDLLEGLSSFRSSLMKSHYVDEMSIDELVAILGKPKSFIVSELSESIKLLKENGNA